MLNQNYNPRPWNDYSIAYNTIRQRAINPESGDTQEGGWPVNNRRVRCGLGQLLQRDWPDVRYWDSTSPPPPANADSLAKRHRINHYQRVRSSDDARQILASAELRNKEILRKHDVTIKSIVTSHLVGDDPTTRLRFARRFLRRMGSVSTPPDSRREREFLDLAEYIVEDFSAPIAWLDGSGQRIHAPEMIHIPDFRASFEITDHWTSPENGIIAYDPDSTVIGVHDIDVVAYNDATDRFLVLNTWGAEWGYRGFGYISPEYFDAHLIEAWTFGFEYARSPVSGADGVRDHAWQARDFRGGTLHGREIVDDGDDERIAWMFAVARDGFLDVEELFVRPGYRLEGHGARLALLAKELGEQMGLPLRALVPFSDVGPANMAGLQATLLKMGLALRPAPFKWAACLGLPGAGSTVTSVRVPSRSMHSPKKEKAGQSVEAAERGGAERDFVEFDEIKRRASTSESVVGDAEPMGHCAHDRLGTSPETSVEYGCRAVSDEEIVLGQVVPVHVTVSLRSPGFTEGHVSSHGSMAGDPEKAMVAQVVARRNVTVVGERYHRFDPPTIDQDRDFDFDIRATGLGDAEVWVYIRQGPAPLVTLTLKPAVVATKSRPPRLAVDAHAVPGQDSATFSFYQLTICEREGAGGYGFSYDLRCPEDGIFHHYESGDLSHDKIAYINDIYAALEGFWAATADDEAEFEAQVRSFGGELFEQLFPFELQQALWERRRRIDKILVISTEPFIPWELVHLKEPRQALPDETLFFCQLGLVRWLFGSQLTPTLRVRPGRSRYIVPQYEDPSLQLGETRFEAEFLAANLGALPITPTLSGVRQAIRTAGEFDLLHFAGHGEAQIDRISTASLMLEGTWVTDGDGGRFYRPTYLTTPIVRQNANLRGEDGGRPLVMVNACRAGRAGRRLSGIGGFAEAFIGRGAGAFVGALWMVGDAAARVFSERFYRSLLDGRTLAEAANDARQAARAPGDATWLSYTVYGHPNAKLFVSGEG